MITKKHIWCVLLVSAILLQVSLVSAAQEKHYYQLGVAAARRGDTESAFMCFRAVLRASEDSLFHEDFLFATGEYYYINGVYAEALRDLFALLKKYPSSDKRIFVLAYILAIAEQYDSQALIDKVRHQIITMQQVSLLFRDSQEYTITSSLHRNLKAVFFIDKIEFYADEVLFQSIDY